MLFNSLSYALFLPAVALVHLVLPRALRAMFLVAASALFYAAWNPRYLVLIGGLTVANHRLGGWLAAKRSERGAAARLSLAVALNLGVLGFFKYSALVASTLDRLLTWVGLGLTIPVPHLELPLGISFFVFEFVHYVVDVARGEPPEPSLLRFVLFASFFPTQIAGPIKRYESFIPQIDRRDRPRLDDVASGLRLVARGLFKKMAIADNFAPLAARGFDAALPGGPGLPPLDAWLTLVAFAVQIYCDFSGYTDIGRGSARLIGFEVPENFRSPYLATSVSEFWRRWHISLSSWLRDYLYVPLGGRERSRSRNLMVTMVLGGLWHGASWKFATWGAFHGAALVAYWRTRPTEVRPRTFARPWRSLLGWVLTITVVLVGWAFFRAGSTRAALALIADLAGASAAAPTAFVRPDRWLVAAVALGGLTLEWLAERRAALGAALVPSLAVRARIGDALRSMELAAAVALLALAVLFRPVAGVRFIYFQF
jgi:D-alanyl-lipoteichoic acid acyltransferase DltB (MBOAT superfamily)